MPGGPCESHLTPVGKFIDGISDANIVKFCKKPQDLVDYVYDNYFGWVTKKVLNRVKSIHKYLKIAKILFWKLRGDREFLDFCRDENIPAIKKKFKETLLLLQDYIAYCTGKSKNYTYKLLNSNIAAFNAGKSPKLSPSENALSKQLEAITLGPAPSPKSHKNNKENEENAESTNTNLSGFVSANSGNNTPPPKAKSPIATPRRLHASPPKGKPSTATTRRLHASPPKGKAHHVAPPPSKTRRNRR